MSDRVVKESSRANPARLDELRRWLVAELAWTLDVAQEALATNEPLSHFGLNSIKAVGFVSQLGEFLGRKIPVALIWNYPTIDALSGYLCGMGSSSPEGYSSGSFPGSAGNQPIAVVGIACRFPGAPDPAAFWEMLQSGRSAIREITPDRWDIDAWYDPDPGKPGRMNARRAGLLDCIDHFDPGFFRISPREAIEMDPQQRLALELTWEALEDAGINPHSLRGSRTGLFVGVVWHDYEILARKAGAEISPHSGTGQAFSIVANRISYFLGLQGPSIALDTACSSSLVSVHLACQSLQTGEASLAIAGGVNLIIDPDTMVALSKFGGLSPTSQLSAFDASADGFVRGEGGGFVVLKPLMRALADGDPIYAVVRGSAVNNDGASNGLTAPNPQAQAAVLRAAYARARVTATDVHYIETHGTGTPLGDPIEAHALGEVFGEERIEVEPLLIGSVKTNIGHLEGAAGIAGFIKLVLSVHHRFIPGSLSYRTPNPHIDFAASRLRVVKTLEPWPDPVKPGVGGVSAFGWGGTNCHVVIEQAVGAKAQVLPLSAPDFQSLKISAEQLRAYLGACAPHLTLTDICATAASRSASMPERVAFTARSISELKARLELFLRGEPGPGIAAGHAPAAPPKIAFVFSPQGSQWLGMGSSLIRIEPRFRAKIAECDRALEKVAGWSLFDELLAAPEASRLNRTETIQPALFAVQVALAELWNFWGIRPDVVAAHSLGEWAAACVAGALSVEEAMRVVVESSRAQARAGTDCGMAVVELAEPEVANRIREWPGDVFVAGGNSPASTLLSGSASILKFLVTSWKQEGLKCSLIDVDVAAHCPRMDPAVAELQGSLTGLRPTTATLPIVSSVTGGYISGRDLGPGHWGQHLRQPVLFTSVMERLTRDACTVFVEISPHPLLLGAMRQTLSGCGARAVVLDSCRQGEDERESLLNSLGILYTLGWPVAWDSVAGGGRNDIALPVPPSLSATPIDLSTQSPLLLTVSGHTAAALSDQAKALARHLRERHDASPEDVAYTLAARRSHLEHRLAVVGAGRQELASALQEFASGRNPVVAGKVRSNALPRIGFVCSGQGPQWWGMGRELLASMPVFRREIARCSDEMKRHVPWDLEDELARGEFDSRLDQTEIAQPALFALQVGLAAIWKSWGIEPDALVGHSLGEITSAYLSGALSFDDAVMLACHRGRLMQKATGFGRMAALELSETEVEHLLQRYSGKVSIAAINGPCSTVISGEAAEIYEIVEAARAGEIRLKILPGEYAFHSAQMEPFGAELVQSVSGLKTRPATVPVYSTVTGASVFGEEFDAVYWGRNIRETVRFSTATCAMLDAGIDTFVELSPHPVLSGMILQCAGKNNREVRVLPSLRRALPERRQMLESLGALFTAGAEIDWSGIYPEGGQVTELPTYRWQRTRHWLELSPTEPTPARKPAANAYHGRRLHSPGIRGFVFESRLSPQTGSLLHDHRVFDRVIVPAPMMVEMVLSAVSEAYSSDTATVKNLAIQAPLILRDAGERTVHLILDSVEEGVAGFKLHSAELVDNCEPGWILHATGEVVIGTPESERGPHCLDPEDADSFRNHCTASFSADDFYQLFERRGVQFGATFRVVEQVSLTTCEAVGSFRLPEQLMPELPQYRIHPVLLDAALQMIAFSHINRIGAHASRDELWIFCGFEHLTIKRAGASRLTCRALLHSAKGGNSDTIRGSAQLYDEEGRLVADVQGAEFRRATRDALTLSEDWNAADLLFEVSWRPWSCPDHGLKRRAPEYLPAAEEFEQLLQTRLVEREGEPTAETEVPGALHRLSAEFVACAFRKLGWKPAPGSRFTTSDLIKHLGIIGRHARLVERLLEMLNEDGMVHSSEGVWEIAGLWPQYNPDSTVRDLRGRFGDYRAELDLFDRCASRLPEVLRGDCDSLQLLFPQGSLESASRIYEDSPMSRKPNELVREVLNGVMNALPKGRVLRVLEIGAGTGGTTAHLLPLLKNVECEYFFTDVSKLFLDAARKKFTDFPFVRYSLFDVEQSHQVQGIPAQYFDVVIAANVLHATRDLHQSLGNVRSVLAPGGLLVLVEGCEPARWIDLIFGLTEGWWRFDDNLRQSHPLLSIEKWKELLLATGFSSAVAVRAKLENVPSLFEQAVVVATAAAEPMQRADIAIGQEIFSGKVNDSERSAWILFGENSPLSEAIARTLEGRGDEVVLIERGRTFATLAERRFMANGSQRDQMTQAIDAALSATRLPCRQAVFLWGATVQAELDEIEVVHDEAIALCLQALYAAQALVSRCQGQGPRLWLVTRGAQPPRTSELPALAAASLWGFGRVVAVEHPEIWGGTIDLDPGASAIDNADALIAQCVKPGGEDQCAFRGGVRFVPRLMRQAERQTTASKIDCSGEGCYLISGGLGGMGLEIARWLAANGARKIVLAGRTPLPPRSNWESLERGTRVFEQVARIREIESQGVVLKSVATDIGDENEVDRLVKSLGQEGWFPILGVVHTAAVADDRLLPQLDLASLEAVFRPKIRGTLTLERCLADQPLQFFVCCSSVGALLGQRGQASYAAANAFLDAFASHRQMKKESALSVNWGGWYGAGLALTSGGRRTIQSLEQRGILGFPPSAGVKALELLMQRGTSQAAVIRMDWARFRQSYPVGEEPPFLTGLAAGTGLSAIEETKPAARSSIREQLLNLDSNAARRAMLETELKNLLAKVLKLDLGSIDVEKSMGALGLDSLLGFELKNRCEQTFGVPLSATMVWNYPTIQTLAGHLAAKLEVAISDTQGAPNSAEGNIAGPASEKSFSAVLASVEQLSDEDAVNALLEGSSN